MGNLGEDTLSLPPPRGLLLRTLPPKPNPLQRQEAPWSGLTSCLSFPVKCLPAPGPLHLPISPPRAQLPPRRPSTAPLCLLNLFSPLLSAPLQRENVVCQRLLPTCPAQTAGTRKDPFGSIPHQDFGISAALQTQLTPHPFQAMGLTLDSQEARVTTATLQRRGRPGHGKQQVAGATQPDADKPGLSWESGRRQRGGLPLCPSGPGGSGEAKSPLSVAAAPLSPPGRAQPTPVACERQGPTEGSGAEGGVSTKGPVLCSDVSSSPRWGGLELIYNHPSPALTPQPAQCSTSYEGSLQVSCWALEQL